MARRPEDSQSWGGRRPGAGRKSPPIKKKTVSICLPINLVEIGQGMAKQRGIPFSALVEQALYHLINASLRAPMETKE